MAWRERLDSRLRWLASLDKDDRVSLRVLVELSSNAPTSPKDLWLTSGWVDGRFAAGTLPLDDLAKLAALPTVRRVALAEALRHPDVGARDTMADAPPWWITGAHPVDAIGVPDATTLDGEGVLVGVIDNVLEPRIPELRDGDQTRVVAYWFQGDTDAEHGSTVFGYGTLYDEVALQKALTDPGILKPEHLPAPNNGDDAHGTFVTCIAAGHGPHYRGVAPAAKVVFVAAVPSGPEALADSKELADAAHFIDETATRLGKPCVINISLGNGLGPHDGSTIVECFLADIAKRRGRAVVVCAGNAGKKSKHATATLVSSSLTLECSRNEALQWETIDLWYEGPESLRLVIAPSNGEQLGPFTAKCGLEWSPTTGAPIVSVESSPPLEGAWGSFRIRLLDRPLLDPGPLRLRLEREPQATSSQRVHGWIDDPSSKLFWVDSLLNDQTTLTSPGVAHAVLTVGACEPEPATSTKPSRLVPFSGEGPTRDGRRKPEMLAHGGGLFVIKPLAGGGSRIDGHASGTSVAAPLVAGAAALILQHDEGASTTEVLAALQELGVPTPNLPPRLNLLALPSLM